MGNAPQFEGLILLLTLTHWVLVQILTTVTSATVGASCWCKLGAGCWCNSSFLPKQSLDFLVRHLCGTLGAGRYIIQTLKDHFQTIYFKYNVYCSSFTKELPRHPPKKSKVKKNSKFILIQKLKQA